MLIKILLILVLIGGFFYLTLLSKRLMRRLTVIALFLAIGICILFPQLTQRVASFVGVGRGADLVSYLSTVFLIFIAIQFYIKAKSFDDNITQLVRYVGIREAERRERE